MNVTDILASHPFHAGIYQGVHYYNLTVDDRLRAVKGFDTAKCREALKLTGLQKTVRTAIERRMRKLARPLEESAQ